MQDTQPRQVFQQAVGDLRDHKDEREIIEKLQGRCPLAQPVRSSSLLSHQSSLAVFETGCPYFLSVLPECVR